jgi:hypothetical protein
MLALPWSGQPSVTWDAGSERHRARWAHVVGVPRPSSTSTGGTAVPGVSRSCSPTASTALISYRIAVRVAPPWRVVHPRGQRDGSRHSTPNHCLGFALGFAMLVGPRSASSSSPGGGLGCAAPAGAAPPWAGVSGAGRCKEDSFQGRVGITQVVVTVYYCSV